MGEKNPEPIKRPAHLKLKQIAEGVYAAIARREGAAHSNAGIVDLGGRTLIFDALGTPKAAKELRAVAEGLTGRPATYVVNSHVDHDHWLGNQAFGADVTILVVLMGDLGFFQFHFPLMGGDRRTLATILERLLSLDLETFVPGHGPLGTEADVRLQIQYIAALGALAAQVVQAGGSAADSRSI